MRFDDATWLSRSTGRDAAFRYALAVSVVLVAFACRLALSPLLSDHAPYLFFVPAVLLAAGAGGLGPGLVATCISVPLILVFFTASGHLSWPDVLNASAFSLIGFGATWIGERSRQARRRAALRQSHLQSIIDTVPEATIVADEHGRMQSFSAAAERMFGYSAGEVIGRSVNILMPSAVRKEHDSALSHYLKSGSHSRAGRAATGQRKDGSTFPIELAIGEMWSGSRKFLTGFVRDLTERHETEARLRELQSELVHISRLTAMGEMASTLAHELNQPLAAISNYLNGIQRIVRRNGDSGELGNALERAAGQALRAGQIIRRLRDFVKHGDGERSVVSMANLIQESSDLTLFGVKEKGVHVSVDLDPTCDRVMVDKVQIQQVLVNLIRNAVDAMEGCPDRELSISTRPGTDGMVIVQVEDSGPGISDDIAERLFQPFATTKPNGVGIGLSISRTIVEAHGGEIEAVPRRSGGTTFRFTLKAARAEDLIETPC